MRKLSPKIVEDIYFYSGTAKEIEERFGCSVRVAKRIKFGETYSDITENFDEAGEILIHNLSWDNICEIRSLEKTAKEYAERFKITKETVYNIQNNKTRKYK